MKLKFRADAKDVIVFIMFAIAWLFVVALAVVNVSAFINDELFTFNVFLAFTSRNIAATLLCFVVGNRCFCWSKICFL